MYPELGMIQIQRKSPFVPVRTHKRPAMHGTPFQVPVTVTKR